MKGITRRFMRKMRGLTRRVKAPFRSHSFRKFMRGGQAGYAGPPPTGQAVPYTMGGPATPINPTGPAASLIPTSFTSSTGQGATSPTGQGATSPTGQGAPSTAYLIKVPAATTNFKFLTAVSTLPATFGTFVPGAADASTFIINLAPKYTPDNLPQFLVTGYVYSTTAGYIQVQRQFGVHAAVAAAGIAIDAAVKKITFTNVTKVNFPYTANDSKGFALYIAFQILN